MGMTRAKERLYLSWAARRTIYGKPRDRRCSPFLADVEDRLKTRVRPGGGKRRKAKTLSQLELF